MADRYRFRHVAVTFGLPMLTAVPCLGLGHGAGFWCQGDSTLDQIGYIGIVSFVSIVSYMLLSRYTMRTAFADVASQFASVVRK